MGIAYSRMRPPCWQHPARIYGWYLSLYALEAGLEKVCAGPLFEIERTTRWTPICYDMIL